MEKKEILKGKNILENKGNTNITCIEARKMFEKNPEITFSRIVQSADLTKPETKTVGTQVLENDTINTSSTKVIIPNTKKTNKPKTSPQTTTPKSTTQPNAQTEQKILESQDQKLKQVQCETKVNHQGKVRETRKINWSSRYTNKNKQQIFQSGIHRSRRVHRPKF